MIHQEAATKFHGERIILVETAWPRLRVVLAGPATTRSVEQALAVRVLDAVRAGERTFGQVDVSYKTTST